MEMDSLNDFLRIYHRLARSNNSNAFESENSSSQWQGIGSHGRHPGSNGPDDPPFLDPAQPPEIPGNLRSLFTVFYVVIMLLAIVGNATTILVIAVNREMRTVTNIFLLSLAISDALIALINMPVQLTFYLQREWTMGEAMCRFSPYMQGVVIVASILTLTALAIDRYYAICHPLRARHVHTITRAVILASIIWVVALLLVTPQIFIQRLEPFLVYETDEKTGAGMLREAYVCAEYFRIQQMSIAYTAFFYVVLYIFPVLTMFGTYGTIAAKLWRRQPIGESADSRREWTRRLREKQRIVRMLVVIVLMFAISWFPFFTLQVYLLFDAAQQHVGHHSFVVAMAFCQLFGYSNSCVNPIIYCFMNNSFQKNFFKTLGCRWATAKEAESRRQPYSSGTEADKMNGATTTRNTALDHSTTV